MNFLLFVISSAISVYSILLLLRVWMQWFRCDYYNPLSQLVIKTTQPVVRPLRRLIPSIGSIDIASIFAVFVLQTLFLPLIHLFTRANFVFEPLYLFLGLLATIKAAGKLMFWIFIIRALMSWLNQGAHPMDKILYQLTEPLLGPIRRVVSPVSGLDFSITIMLFFLFALNMLARDIFPFWGGL